jgi:hypothetical protein
MHEQTRRKLDRHLALEAGARWMAIILGAAAALAAVAALAFIAPPPRTVREVDAVVRGVTMGSKGRKAHPSTVLDVELPDGRIVRTRSIAPLAPPPPGARIVVHERSMLEFRSYVWEDRAP